MYDGESGRFDSQYLDTQFLNKPLLYSQIWYFWQNSQTAARKPVTSNRLPPNPYLCHMASEMSLGDAIRLYLKKSKMGGNMQALKIHQAWEQIMGKTIARYTDKIEINQQVLYISTNTAPLKQELMYQKENIIKRVNEVMGEAVIKDVVIR